MSRIIAGDAKSITLSVPASGTRPTSDRVRESLFAVLEARGTLAETDTVLDLYCGTGALALEAVSRGANSAVLVDASAAAIQVAKLNCGKLSETIGKLGTSPRLLSLRVVRAKVAPWLRQNQHSKFDLVFADPPYELSDKELWQELAAVRGLLEADGLLIIERAKRRERSVQPNWLAEQFSKTWGDTEVTGYRLRSAGPT